MSNKYRLISEEDLKKLLHIRLRYQALLNYNILDWDWYSDAINSMADSLNKQYELFDQDEYEYDDVFNYSVKEEVETYLLVQIKGE